MPSRPIASKRSPQKRKHAPSTGIPALGVKLFADPPSQARITEPIPASSAWINDMQEKVSQKQGEWVVLLRPARESYLRASGRMLRMLAGLGYESVYVSLAHPQSRLLSILKQEEVDTQKLYVADAASMQGGGMHASSERVVYVHAPHNLTDVSVAIDALLSRLQGRKKVVVIDSLSTLLAHHSPRKVHRFASFLISKLRAQGASAAFLSPSTHSESASLHQLVSPLCDEVVDVP